MKRPRAQGLAHSVQARLKAKAEAEGRPFAELLDLYGIERFLHRLGTSKHRDQFVLKGALLLRHWLGTDTRPTRDVDLLGPSGLDAEAVRAFIADLLEMRVDDDGLQFDPSSLRVEPVREASPAPGHRARFEGYLGPMAIHYQVDVGLADAVYPPETDVRLAGLLDLPMAAVRAYTPYSVIAEKIEAIVALGDANSRMKDYYDLAALAGSLSFEGETLAEAIHVCFTHRSTVIPEAEPVGMSAEFAADDLNTRHWAAFRRKSRLSEASADFAEVLARIRRFALPPLRAAAQGRPFERVWPPGGPWKDRGE
jgi:hypothetical protein